MLDDDVKWAINIAYSKDYGHSFFFLRIQNVKLEKDAQVLESDVHKRTFSNDYINGDLSKQFNQSKKWWYDFDGENAMQCLV